MVLFPAVSSFWLERMELFHPGETIGKTMMEWKGVCVQCSAVSHTHLSIHSLTVEYFLLAFRLLGLGMALKNESTRPWVVPCLALANFLTAL